MQTTDLQHTAKQPQQYQGHSLLLIATAPAPSRGTLAQPWIGSETQQRVFFPVLVIALLAVVILCCVPGSMADPDIWWHLRNAQQMLTLHTFPTEDVYSFTALHAPWMDHEWMAELPFYFGWELAGANGVFCVTAFVIELIFMGVLRLCWSASRSMVTAALVTLVGALLATVSFGPRTLLFGWLCLVLELLILDASGRRRGAVFSLPFLFGFWVNLHGSWVIGLVVLLVHCVTSSVNVDKESLYSLRLDPAARGRLWTALALSVLALFANPYGWRLVAYPFDLAFRQKLNIANVQEWQSLDWHSPRGRMVLGFLLLLVLRQLWRGRRWSLTELSLVLIGLYSAVSYSRFLFLLAILGAPAAARSFAGRKVPRVTPLLQAALLLCMLGFSVHWVRTLRTPDDRTMAQFPVAAVKALQGKAMDGPVFSEFLWGGYMIWHMPTLPVFIDSRVDLFEYNGTFRDYLDIIHIVNSEDLLARHHIRYVFFEPDSPLVYLLRRTGRWQVEYEGPEAILLERISGTAP